MVAAAAGCSRTEESSRTDRAAPGTTTPSADSTEATDSSSSPSEADASDASGRDRPEGLVVLDCDHSWGEVYWTLEAYEPRADAAAASIARFPAPNGYTIDDAEADYLTAFACDTKPASVVRQLFDPNYTAVAVSMPLEADASEHIGVLRADGSFEDFTKASNGFSSAPLEHSPVFNPGRPNEIAFRSGGETGVFLTSREGELSCLDSRRATDSRRRCDVLSSGEKREVFSPSGKWMLPAPHVIGYALHNPDDTLAVRSDPGERVVSVSEPAGRRSYFFEIPNGTCDPDAWLDSRRFLCSGDRAWEEGGQLWLVQLRGWGQPAIWRSLLPETDRSVYDSIPSPDGLSAAFLSRQGEATSLFVVALDRGSEPVEVATVSAGEDGEVRLIGWEAGP